MFRIDFAAIAGSDVKPRPFEPLDGLFWAEPYLASHILFAHLDSTNDDASRPLDRITAEAAWLDEVGRDANSGRPGRALDLGCGPGLYVRELVRRGWSVTGVDISPTSIEYASQESKEENLRAEFILADLHSWKFPSDLDLILLVFGTFGTFSPKQASKLIARCYDALRPGGVLVFDTFGKAWWEAEQNRFPPQGWAAHPRADFWSSGPHLVLNRRYVYPSLRTFAHIWTVVESDRVRRFAFWYRWYDRPRLERLFSPGWTLRWFGAMDGSPLGTTSWITAVARKEEPFGPEQLV